jgi:Ca2+-transporting ATPase
LFYDESLKDVYLRLNSSDKGLSKEESQKRLKEQGYNELEQKNKHTALKVLVNQLKNFLILLLIFAAVVSLVLGEHLEFYGISGIIILTIVLGFIQEYRAEKSMEALEKISAPYATVIRSSTQSKIFSRELVVGDVIVLSEGDIIPADVRLIEANNLEVDEASLTGESVPSKKTVRQLSKDLSPTDQLNMGFSGTIVTKGSGKAIVTATGKNTEFGKIANTISEIEDTATPLQIKFEKMARQLTYVVLGLVGIVFLISLFTADKSNLEWGKFVAELFIFSLSLAVAAVPSALAAIVTISLSRGASRLAEKNMIVKRLPAAESLGAVTVICSDKTGTLTKNQMTIKKIYLNGKILDVTGSGYEPKGDILYSNQRADKKNFKDLDLLLRTGYLCNDSKLTSETKDDGQTKWVIIGDPTEGSLMVLGKKGGIDEKDIEENFSKVQDLPFDSDRKLMSVVYENYSTKKTDAYVKGAPDFVLNKCSKIIVNGKIRKITKKDKDEILKINNEFAEDALRILGLAYRDVSKVRKYDISTVEDDLVFVGLVGMIDPAREGVKDAISQCDSAGIRVMMITGDHPTTAKAIARSIGLLRDGDLVLTGSELEKLSDNELERQIEDIRIIARTLPIQKTRIVDILQKKGHVVAMTGDGVNDAPALKKADIGIAMGITGTDVSKEVSKTILVDDNFITIVNGISEGRNIYDRILKSTKYLLSCNVGEVTSVFFAVLFRFPLPLLTLQILLMNLLTDALPALGLGSEEAENDVMKHNPRNPKDNPLTREMLWLILIFGFAMGLGTLITFSIYKDHNIDLARSVAFTTLVMFEMFAVMSARSFSSFNKINPFSNKWLALGIFTSIVIQIIVLYTPFMQKIFGTVALGMNEWILILAVSSFGFIMMEIGKFFVKEKYKSPKGALPKL